MAMLKATSLAVLASLFLSACGTTAVRPTLAGATPTNICELMAKPEDFVGRTVAFHASVEGDGEHLALLWDPSCHRGLRFGLKSARPAKTAEEIHDAAWGTDAGTLDKDIQADFTATLARTDEKTMWPQAMPYFLDVVTISNLIVKPANRR